MKLLFISPRFSGGIGGHAAMLADQLTNYGYEVKKMNVGHIPIKNLKNPSFALFGTIKGILSTEKFDIVHAFNVPSGFAMRYIKSKKKVLSLHGVFSTQVKALHSSTLSYLASNAESRVLQWADKLTTDSRISQKEYKKKLGYDLEYLPSAIDTSKFEEIIDFNQGIENQVVYVGRDSYEKGIDILRDAEPKIKGKVVYCTNMPWTDTMKVVKSSTILVAPSRMESLPTNIKEAFYLRTPVVATNVGGIPELITSNETGILVEPNNAEKLAEAVNMLLADTELQQKLSLNAYQFVKQNLTWEVVLPKYIDFYENLLKN